MHVKRVGSRSRDDLLEIVDINIPAIGKCNVTIRETMGGNCIIGGFPLQRARTLAKGTMYPFKGRRTKIINQFTFQGCEHVTLQVS